jgi:hypothetical protein
MTSLRSLRSLRRADVLVGLAVSLAVLVVYALTLSPAVNTLDGGELAAAAATLGVAHPTGYPLFTLLGRAAAMIPLGESVIFRLNALTAVFGAAAAFFFFRLFLALLSESAPGNAKPRARDNVREKPDANLLAAAAAALTFAFTRTYWQQSIAYEVYSLHLLFVSLVLCLFFAALRAEGARADRAWLLFAYALGLSFANHMMTIALAPGCALLVALARRRGLPPLPRVLGSAAAFATGLSLYAYLPVRASLNPAMNWGNPSTWENFRWHISGHQFWRHMFQSRELANWKLAEYFRAFPSEFGYLVLLAAAAGLWFLLRGRKPLLTFVLVTFAACVAYSINYGITDIESYFLVSYVAVMIAAAFGLRALLSLLAARAFPLRAAALAACAAAFLSPLKLHYRAVDLSGEYAAQDYCRNALLSADPGGVVITDVDARVTMIGFYLQRVEGVRPDVAIIDRGYLAYPYYSAQLERNHPWLAGNLRLPEPAGGFNDAHDTAVVDAALRDFARRNHAARPVYFTNRLTPAFFPGLSAMPEGLLFRLHGDSLPPLGPARDFTWRPFPRENEDIGQIRDAYAVAYFNQGAYRLWRGDRETGMAYLRKTLALKPYFSEASNMLRYAEEHP